MSGVLFLLSDTPCWAEGVCLCVPCEQQTDAAPSARVLDCSWTHFLPHPHEHSPLHAGTELCVGCTWLGENPKASFGFPLTIGENTPSAQPEMFHPWSPLVPLATRIIQGLLLGTQGSRRTHNKRTQEWLRHPTCSLLHQLPSTSSSFVCFWIW